MPLSKFTYPSLWKKRAVLGQERTRSLPIENKPKQKNPPPFTSSGISKNASFLNPPSIFPTYADEKGGGNVIFDGTKITGFSPSTSMLIKRSINCDSPIKDQLEYQRYFSVEIENIILKHFESIFSQIINSTIYNVAINHKTSFQLSTNNHFRPYFIQNILREFPIIPSQINKVFESVHSDLINSLRIISTIKLKKGIIKNTVNGIWVDIDPNFISSLLSPEIVLSRSIDIFSVIDEEND